MKSPSVLIVFFITLVSVLFFSGQASRSYPQRQPTAQQQRQITPPKPTPAPSQPAPTAEMPSYFLLPEDIVFPEMPQGASRTFTLYGDPKSEGLYVTRTLIPKGTQTIPHFHPDARTVTVLSGICYYGRGEEFDENHVQPMPPGSFFTEPAGVPHYIWAKESDVIVQTTSIGPSGTQIISAKTPKVPANSPGVPATQPQPPRR